MSLQFCTVADVEFHSDFTLMVKVDAQLTAVVGFFDVDFQSLLHQKSFTTSPYTTPTHWKQTVFLLQNPISVVAGMCTGYLSIDGQISNPNLTLNSQIFYC